MSLANAALLVALGLIPSLVWMSFFLKRDGHPEPSYLVTKTFLMGIIIALPAVLLQWAFTYLNPWPELDSFLVRGSLFFVWAAFVEEFLKYYAVRLVALTDPEFDEPVDAMIYMMMAGLGFAAIENILVLFRTIPDGFHTALSIWGLRSVGATLLHALASGLLGYFLALSWFFRHHHQKLVLVGLALATFFHFVFNIFLAGIDEQLHGLLLATALLGVMSFLVSILFVRIKRRSAGKSIRLSKSVDKDISVA